MTAAHVSPAAPRHPLSWKASGLFGALFVVAYLAAYRLVEVAFRQPAPAWTPAAWVTIGVGIPVVALLFRYVTIWTIRSESAQSFGVWMIAIACGLTTLWPFAGARTLAHALAAALVGYVTFSIASRYYR